MVINSSKIIHMPTLLQKLHSQGTRLKFLAVYHHEHQLKEFEKLCMNYHHQVLISCNAIQTAKILADFENKLSFDGVAVDIRMVELDGYEFVQSQFNVPLYLTYDRNDSTIKESLLNNAINHIQGNANCWIASLATKRDHATQTDEFDDVPPETNDSKKNGNENQPISLAFLKNPEYDDSKVTGVSTELFLGLTENDSNDDSNKRKRKQNDK